MSNHCIIYGKHASLAAINNPRRNIKNIYITDGSQKLYQQDIPKKFKIHPISKQMLNNMLPAGSIHQNIAVETYPLPPVELKSITQGPLLLLDHITDTHNIGAIFRSAAAFGIKGIITTKDHCPELSGTIAKTACGGIEQVPLITIANLANAIKILKKSGFWIYGLDGHTQTSITDPSYSNNTALILGAEGQGLRNRTKDLCDQLVKIPMEPTMESLNVSNAAAIAMWHLHQHTANN